MKVSCRGGSMGCFRGRNGDGLGLWVGYVGCWERNRELGVIMGREKRDCVTPKSCPLDPCVNPLPNPQIYLYYTRLIWGCFFLFSLFSKASFFPLHDRCVNGALSLHSSCAFLDTLSPIVRCTDGALSLHGRCTGGVLREKNGASRPFPKVDEVEVYLYHLGEVAFDS